MCIAIMATAAGVDPCFMCKHKYSRDRFSLCDCKHCSKSFCIDCIREHTNEIQLEADEAANLANQTKELVDQKRKWIDDEVKKSKEQIGQWLEKHIHALKSEVEVVNKKLDDAGKEAHVTYIQ